ncbi:MAG: TIGR02147 family protein [Bdellovibrionales bacterium]|nr:TIGR02147 family protein [Bdellovibrionales bacterium]
MSPINVYGYEDYRTYLADSFNALKKTDPKVSHRSFAKKAGIKSSSFVLSVMKGKDNLSLKTIEGISKALGHDREEAFFFKNLVLLNQATTIDERLVFAQHVLKSKQYRKVHPLAEAKYHYFTRWYFVAIKELVGIEGFKSDPAWIARRLANQVTREEAEVALSELIKLNLIARDEKGNLRQTLDTVMTPDEVTSAFIVPYHEELIGLGSESIRRYPREEREISATTFRVTHKNFQKIKEILQRFRKEMVEVIEAGGSTKESAPKAEALYQLNLQLFPLAPFVSKSSPEK